MSPVQAFTNEDGLRDYRPTADLPTGPPWILPFWIVIAAFVLGFFLGSVIKAESGCVTLQVRPRLMVQPSDITVETHIRRQTDHRSYVLVWDSDRGSTGSSGPHPLEGERGPALFRHELRDQPAANYAFLATVANQAGRATCTAQASIAAPE